MPYELTYEEFATYAGPLVLDWLKDDELSEIFSQMCQRVHEVLPQMIVRGKEKELAGVSNPDEKFIFYVSRRNDVLHVKFPKQEARPFLACEKETLLSEAESAARMTMVNPEMFKLFRKPEKGYGYPGKSAKTAATKEIEAAATGTEGEIIDDTELYLKLGVDPVAYSEIEIIPSMFPVRVYNCLKRADIDTIGQLLSKKESELVKLKNFGRTSFRQMKAALRVILGQQSTEPDGEMEEESTDTAPAVQQEPLTPKAAVNAIRTTVSETVLSYAGVVQSESVLDRECEEFVFQLKQSLLPLFEQLSLPVRNKEITLSWLTERRTLAEIGADYDLSRERIRQLCQKSLKRILSKVKWHSDEETADALQYVSDAVLKQEPEVIFVYLQYLQKKHGNLFELLDSLIFSVLPAEDHNELFKQISMAPASRKKPKPVKKAKEQYEPPVPLEKKCPRCGAQLVIYTARRGANPGHKFVGCSRFPQCRYTADLVFVEAGTNKILDDVNLNNE